MRESIVRPSDGSTVDTAEEDAEQADLDARAKRVIFVNSSGSIIKLTRSRENFLGSAGTGSDGDANRVFTLTTINSVDIVEVFYNGTLLIETSQYTINNSTKQVTISFSVYDTDSITIFYNV